MEIGQTISHYKILRKLGHGGMGDVYHAHDEKLDRSVALKVLKPEFVGDEDHRRRFLREARSAAAVTHPFIGSIYEAGETDGTLFIAMEYVDGQTIRGLLTKGALPVSDATRYATEIAEGLTIAHRSNLVHRDLKPDNVMVASNGHVKILDFGLAKLVEKRDQPTTLSISATQTAHETVAGVILGTPAYMSPEQARGEPVDSRSDIFSVGGTLYEMGTGKAPFLCSTQQDTLASILKDEPVSSHELNQEVPGELDRIISRCLHKKPEDRYNDTRDLVAALKALQRETTSTVPQPIRVQPRRPWARLVAGMAVAVALVGLVWVRPWESINDSSPSADRTRLVVLPFENLGDAEHEYFADGITGEITARLARLSGLGVISRTSAVKYKQTEKSLRQIGEDLDVSYVLEGTIQYASVNGMTRVRIHPQLIRVDDDTNVWGESYDEVLDDIFSVQSVIALQVAAALDVTLLDQEKRNLEVQPTDNQEAYDAFLRAQQLPVISPERSPLRIQLLESAVRLDPDFALAHAALSEAYSLTYHEGDRRDTNTQRALSAAKTALELDPNLPEAKLALGWYHYRVFRDYDRALEHLDMARQKLPNDSRVLHAVGIIQKRQGQFVEAIETFERALELSPRSGIFVLEIGICNRHLGRFADALRYFELTSEMAPDELGYHLGAKFSSRTLTTPERHSRATLARRVTSIICGTSSNWRKETTPRPWSMRTPAHSRWKGRRAMCRPRCESGKSRLSCRRSKKRTMPTNRVVRSSNPTWRRHRTTTESTSLWRRCTLDSSRNKKPSSMPLRRRNSCPSRETLHPDRTYWRTLRRSKCEWVNTTPPLRSWINF
jgi:serine/threonine protein kinase/tetratricopeptide (TPR) repeat protein